MSPATSDDKSDDIPIEGRPPLRDSQPIQFPHQAMGYSEKFTSLEEDVKLEKMDYLALFIAFLQTVFLPLLIMMGIFFLVALLFSLLG
ncbi:MAG: hypothetical protein ACFFCQ_19015 [Promethearchaeota archaeon]